LAMGHGPFSLMMKKYQDFPDKHLVIFHSY
jgi:hypothetical protein